MKKILIIPLIIISLFANGQLTSLVFQHDTLFNFDPSTGIYTQITKLSPPIAGNSGKIFSNNGTNYTWINPVLSNFTNDAGFITSSSLSPYAPLASPTFTGTFTVAAGAIGNAALANGAVANLSGTNSGDNAANSTYASDYRAANFVAGTNYLAPNGSAAALTSFPTFNQNTTGTAGGLSADIAESQVAGLVADLALKAPLASPTFTGTVSGITGAMVGLGNVTNESKATMFNNATFTGTFTVAAGAIGNAALANGAVANLSGTNSGDNAANSIYASDYRAANFVAGTNYLSPNGSAAALTAFPTFNQNTTGTASGFTTARNINGVSFNGTADINVNTDILAYAALGSPVLAESVNQPLAYANTSTNLTDGQIKYAAVYLPKAATLTGVKFYVRVLGSYTGDNNNRIGLYSYSGGNLTLVASSANNASLWTSAANAVQTIPFSGTYAASAGLYFVGFIYNNSAQTTAPALAGGVSVNNVAMISTAYGFTNSAKLQGTSSGTDIPSSIAMSAITGSTVTSYVALY